jgi:hypothetical protein
MTTALTDADLDALIARLQERATQTAADDPTKNMAGLTLDQIMPLATQGRVQVSPGQVIASSWGNMVWDQSVNTFANNADRDTQWTAPKDGALAYTADTKTLWLRRGGAWVVAGVSSSTNSAYLGTYDPNQPLKVWVGRFNATTNANGDITVALPAGVVTFVAAVCSSAMATGISCNWNQTSTSLTSVAVRAFQPGGAVLANGAVIGTAVCYYQ